MSFPWKSLIVGQLVASAVALTVIAPPPPRLVWNPSESVPIGLYEIHSVDRLAIGELVLAEPPEPLASFLDNGGYLPRGVPLLKHVAALPGQSICRTDRVVTVDGRATAMALDRDSRGRVLPVWTGCRLVGSGQVFLLNPAASGSLDGRYFGPIPASSITGRATPIWIPGARS